MTPTRSSTTALLLVVGLLTPLTALADARLEARRHFKNGMGSISRGDYESGITELRLAYTIKPHPSVLYNIARAYQEMGKLDLAAESYRLFLSANPPEEEAAPARTTLAQLDAAMKKASPAPADIPLPPPSAPRTRTAPAAEVAQFDALVKRLEVAVKKAEEHGAETAAERKTPVSGSSGEGADATDESRVESANRESAGEAYEERVETASRYAQSTLDAPNATTIITAEDIRLSGAINIVDLLRRVPGLDLMRLGVGSANVSIRGFNQRVANKVLVLVDGRSEYLDFIGQTEWSAIPVDLHEIERIEVIRGPGSALYGANAVLGVINIITRTPGTHPMAEAHGLVGTGNTYQGALIGSGASGRLAYRTSVGYGQSDKWTRDYAEERPDVQSAVRNPNLGVQAARGSLSATYAFQPDVRLTARGGVSRFFSEVYAPGSLPNFFFDGLASFTQADLAAGPVALKVFWNHLDTAVGPQYSVVGQRSIATSLTSNVLDAELLVSKRFTLGGEHHAQVGVEGRSKRVNWQFIGGLASELHAGVYAQDEYRPISTLGFVGSYRLDYAPLLDSGKPGAVQSPRLSAVWRLAEGQALRASYATAFREPTFLENYTQIAFPIPGNNGGSLSTTGDRKLRPEQLQDVEVGYRGESVRLGLDYDLTLYVDQVKDLIELSQFSTQGYAGSYDPRSQSYIVANSQFANDPTSYRALGAELGLRFSPVDRLEVKGSAAFERINALSTPPGGICAPCTEAPAVKVWAGITYRTPIDLDLTVDGSYTSSSIWVERAPSAADLSAIAYTPNALAGYVVMNARAAYRILKDHITVALVGNDLVGSHDEHPLGNLITRRIFLTLSVTP